MRNRNIDNEEGKKHLEKQEKSGKKVEEKAGKIDEKFSKYLAEKNCDNN